MVATNPIIMKSILTTLLFLISFSVAIAKEPPGRVTEILNSGDGKSAKTAFQVYTIDEEYMLLDYLRLNPKMQMLSIIDDEYNDILKVGEMYIYFKMGLNLKYQLAKLFRLG